MGWFGAENTGLIVRLCIAVAGGGFAGFLMGYFGLQHMGVKAGGAMGVMVLLWLTDPGKPITAAVNREFQKCQTNIRNESYDVAVTSCRLAVEQLSDDYEPAYMLGQAYYHLGNYALAIQSWKQAIERGADPAPFKYSIGLALLEDKKFQDAAAVAKEVASETTDPPCSLGFGIWPAMRTKAFGTSAKARKTPFPTR